MWFIWIAVFLLLLVVALIDFWIFSKIWIAIKKDEKKLEKEDKEEQKNA